MDRNTQHARSSRGDAILVNKHLTFKYIEESAQSGRFMSVMAEIQGQTVILSCVYAPCVSDPVFLPNIENKLHEFGTFPIIMGGDYNQVFDPILDHKPPNL